MTTDLVLLHGASGNASTWDRAPWSWARVHAIDLPGRGASPGPPCERISDTAAWLVDELDRRDQAAPVLLGHSMGGAVALQIALDHPGRLSGLILVASSSRLKVAPAILDAVAASTPDAPYRLDAAFGPGTPDAVIERYAQLTSTTPPATALADWRACDAFDVRERLPTVHAPTLVVHGSADVLTPPRYQERLAQGIAGTARVELADVGHMLPWEAPQDLSDMVRDWWQARTSSTPS